MSEQSQPQITLTEADHFAPDGTTPRITDPEKAHFVANEVKIIEDASAQVRKEIQQDFANSHTVIQHPANNEISYMPSEDAGNIDDMRANKEYLLLADEAGRRTLRLSEVRKNLSIKNIAADNRAEAAGKIYDVLNESKR